MTTSNQQKLRWSGFNRWIDVWVFDADTNFFVQMSVSSAQRHIKLNLTSVMFLTTSVRADGRTKEKNFELGEE